MDDHSADAQQPWPDDVSIQHGEHSCLIRTLPITEAQSLFYSAISAEGWNPGLRDPTLFSSLDPRGFHAFYILDPLPSSTTPTLTPVCLLSTLLVDDSQGFLGPYITFPSYRGQGFGSLLFDWGLTRLNPATRAIGLDSTVEQQPYYQRRGFIHTAAIEHRYSGIVQSTPSPPLLHTDHFTLPALDSRVSLSDVHALFASCSESKLSTPAYVSALLHLPDCHSFISLTSSNTLTGLIVARRAGLGYRLAPLFARDVDTARSLLSTLQSAVGREAGPDCSLHIDVPDSHTEALQLMKEVGLCPIFQSVRMSTRTPPPVKKEWVWGSEPCP